MVISNAKADVSMTYRSSHINRPKARAIARKAERPVWLFPLASLFLLLLALRLIGPWAS